MELIGLAFLAIAGVFGAAFSRLLADDFKSWRPRLVEALIKRALTKLPEEKRERFGEEWRSHVDEVPGDLSKLIVALGFGFAAREITAQLTYGRGFFEFVLVKRAFDVAFSIIVIAVWLPGLILISLLVKLDSTGPLMFRKQRRGLKGRPMYVYKFRTMHVRVEGEHHDRLPHTDYRVTRVGRFLRWTSLDEFPQFFNVLRGDMSVVGRGFKPTDLKVSKDHDHSDGSEGGTDMKPGLTGWAQVEARYGSGSDDDSEARRRARLEHDKFYADNWSLWFDLKIILKTIFIVTFKGSNRDRD